LYVGHRCEIDIGTIELADGRPQDLALLV